MTAILKSPGTDQREESVSHTLSDLHLENFRCITSADFGFDCHVNVFSGGNGAGKTSILEAIHLLGRGRSFRIAENRGLIRSGAEVARISGTIGELGGTRRVRAAVEAHRLEVQLNGQVVRPAELASTLPLQAISSDIDELIAGPPDGRRRLLDWGVFHVKPDYLATWRLFRRALLQRNALLRQGWDQNVLQTWDAELTRAALKVDQARRDYFEHLEPGFRRFSAALLGQEAGLCYQRGWSDSEDFGTSLRTGQASDLAAGYTRVGPHRADLVVEFQSEQSRRRASRGQLKLLGAALILAQTELVAERLQRRVALLLDEPAADLDAAHLERFIRVVLAMNVQLFIATISGHALPLHEPVAMFHVEHGSAKALL